jgi:hypothetical protein
MATRTGAYPMIRRGGSQRPRWGVNVAALLAAAASSATVLVPSAYKSFGGDTDEAMASVLAGRTGSRVLVTEEMVARLPEPVQRYMRFAGVIGTAIPETVRLTQTGRIRADAESGWMNFTATEVYSTSPPAFVWKVSLPSERMPLAIGRDLYLGGRGGIEIRFAALAPLAAAEGPEIDQGALMRFLNEMTWFPAAFLGPHVSWRGIDGDSAEVTLTDRGRSVSAVMTFAADGRPTGFTAERYRMVGGGYELDTWSTPFTSFGEFNGVTVPVAGTGVWELPGGDLDYIELTVTGVEYDP